MKRILPALAVLLGGCAMTQDWSMPDVAKWFSRENAIAVEEVRRAQVCNTPTENAAVTLFPDLASAHAWEASRGVALIGDAPLPDGPYALVEMGTRNTGGYGVAVSRTAGRDGDRLILKATFIAPAAGRMVAEMISSPCALVSLPQAHYSEIWLIDQDGKRRARSGPAS
jgi:hypothetical protein